MSHLIATSGISGSGKSTWAKAWVAEDADNRVRVNRDEIRASLFETPDYKPKQEDEVTVVQNALMLNALVSGKDLVVDNTHLHPMDIARMEKLATENGATFEVKEFKVDIDVAKARIAQRAESGGLFVPDFVVEAQLAKQEKFADKEAVQV